MKKLNEHVTAMNKYIAAYGYFNCTVLFHRKEFVTTIVFGILDWYDYEHEIKRKHSINIMFD